MLELYFKYPKVLRRLRRGALGEEMDRIAAHVFALGDKRGLRLPSVVRATRKASLRATLPNRRSNSAAAVSVSASLLARLHRAGVPRESEQPASSM